jgi:hypothetical protein
MLDFQMACLVLFLVSAFLLIRYTAGDTVADPYLFVCAFYSGGPGPRYLRALSWEEALREALVDPRTLMGLILVTNSSDVDAWEGS